MPNPIYRGGYDLENVIVCFGKCEPLCNTDKIFRLDVQRDLFDNYGLQITKGRTERSKRIVMRGHISELDLIKDLIDLVARRFEHGYSLLYAQLTDDLVPHFDKWIGSDINPQEMPDINLALFQSLTLLRNRASGTERFKAFAAAFDKTIHSLDPQTSTSRKSFHRDAGRQMNLPTLDCATDQDYTDPRRRVIRFLVESLLADEPLVKQSIFRSLQVPGRYEGNNIVNFAPMRRREQGSQSVRLVSLIEQEPRISDLGERLFYAGIKTVCQLMEYSEAELISEYEASAEDIMVLRYVMGQHGLHLAADTRSTIKA